MSCTCAVHARAYRRIGLGVTHVLAQCLCDQLSAAARKQLRACVGCLEQRRKRRAAARLHISAHAEHAVQTKRLHGSSTCTN